MESTHSHTEYVPKGTNRNNQPKSTDKEGSKQKNKKPNDEINKHEDVFCTNGCLWQHPTYDGRCPACGKKIVRKSTYETASEKFRVIYEKNKHALNQHIFNDFETRFLVIPVPIGHLYYFVPVRYFIEWKNIECTDRSQYDNFFEYIRTHCESAKM